MNFSRKDEIVKKTINTVGNAAKAVHGDPIAIANIIEFLVSGVISVHDYYFWEKIKMHFEGVYLTKEDRIKMSAIFAENEEKDEYSRRLIKIIDDIDTKNKTKYIINLTRALLMGFIKLPDYYRLCDAIRNTIEEDLQYLTKNINKNTLDEDISIHFLAKSGLVMQTVIAGNGDNEFEFSPLGRMLDKYGLDYENENKYKYSSDIPDRLSNYLIKTPKVYQQYEESEW